MSERKAPKRRKSTKTAPGTDKRAHTRKALSPQALALLGRDAQFPDRIPLLIQRGDVVFPQTAMTLVVNRLAGIKLIEDVYPGGQLIGFVTQRDPEVEEASQIEDFFPTLTIGSIPKMLKFPDGSIRVVAQGDVRARLVAIEETEPYLVARIEPLHDQIKEGVELEAAVHHVNSIFQRLVEASQQIPEELQVAAMNTGDPSRLADLLATNLPFSIEEKEQLLAEPRVYHRLERLGSFLARHLEILELSNKIQVQVGNEISRAQREHFLRQQIKAIQEELGESEKDTPEIEELHRKLRDAKLPTEAMTEAERELDRLSTMHPSSAEHSIIRTYLDWLAALPWEKSTRDRLNLKVARQVLDADHYNLSKVKDRILEYLAVRKLKKDMKGPILCFVGPPGTGKTSLGKSIAKALGREFARISLGGVHDEAEIRGHRRTYVASMPGRVIQALRKAGANNPVFMLDEVDKLGRDFRGDPAAALLEVLDPEQNNTFRDHYLDVDFDLSKVMFIATANVLDTIPAALRDRMEVLELPGYSEEEKMRIAREHLIPKQLEAHGLLPKHVKFTDESLQSIVADYTRESGLRNLEREIASVCRKVARKHAEGKTATATITPAVVFESLGPPKYFREAADRAAQPGVSVGLAWTPVGGEILFIEATAIPGKGSLTLTGLLGDSMRESAQAAMSYLKSHAQALKLDPARINKTDVHIHVPAGAVPKDGPSAGVAISAALISLFRDEPIRQSLAMTGEVTLTGRVLPVGGVREKMLAARRAGIKSVLIPRRNEKDLVELPEEVKNDLEFHIVETLDDVIPHLFPEANRPRTKPSGARSARAGAGSTTLPKAAAESGRRPRSA